MKTSGCWWRYLCREVVPAFIAPRMKKLGKVIAVIYPFYPHREHVMKEKLHWIIGLGRREVPPQISRGSELSLPPDVSSWNIGDNGLGLRPLSSCLEKQRVAASLFFICRNEWCTELQIGDKKNTFPKGTKERPLALPVRLLVTIIRHVCVFRRWYTVYVKACLWERFDKKSLFRQGVYGNHGLCVKLNPTAWCCDWNSSARNGAWLWQVASVKSACLVGIQLPHWSAGSRTEC